MDLSNISNKLTILDDGKCTHFQYFIRTFILAYIHTVKLQFLKSY